MPSTMVKILYRHCSGCVAKTKYPKNFDQVQISRFLTTIKDQHLWEMWSISVWSFSKTSFDWKNNKQLDERRFIFT